jgi:energy-coupling factor transport system ATP-binding protein
VLDEPTSSLDPGAAEEVMAALTRLVHDLGLTVLVAEHRLERVAQFADRLVHVAGGRVVAGDPRAMWGDIDIAPPVVRLARTFGWEPLPLSVREARRHATPLRARLGSPDRRVDELPGRPVDGNGSGAGRRLLRARGIVVRYGQLVANRDVDLDLHAGRVVALMGRNGSGKSTLLWALQGSGPRHGGSIEIEGGGGPDAGGGASGREGAPGRTGRAPRRARSGRRAGDAPPLVGLVPQSPSDLLYLDSVDAECDQADHDSGRPAGSCREILGRIAPEVAGPAHPRDLSEGQRLALVLAVPL